MKAIKSVLWLFGLLGSSWLWAASVNINTASAVEIAESLNGVGEARAAAIVAFREQNGPFISADQLLQIKGRWRKNTRKESR